MFLAKAKSVTSGAVFINIALYKPKIKKYIFRFWHIFYNIITTFLSLRKLINFFIFCYLFQIFSVLSSYGQFVLV